MMLSLAHLINAIIQCSSPRNNGWWRRQTSSYFSKRDGRSQGKLASRKSARWGKLQRELSYRQPKANSERVTRAWDSKKISCHPATQTVIWEPALEEYQIIVKAQSNKLELLFASGWMFLILNAALNCLSWKCLIMQRACDMGMHHREGQGLNNWPGKASQLKTSRTTMASKGNTEVGDGEGTARGKPEESKTASHGEKELQCLSLSSPL